MRRDSPPQRSISLQEPLQASFAADSTSLQAELARIRPAEVLANQALPDIEGPIRCLDALAFDTSLGFRQLTRHFGTHDLTGFGLTDDSPLIGVSAAVLEYARLTQCQDLDFIDRLTVTNADEVVALDAHSRRNLEIDRRLDGSEDSTLFVLFNTTRTPMGARLLRRWLNGPSRDRTLIGERQNGVAALIEGEHEQIRALARELGDLERVVSRLALGTASPRDLGRLRAALLQFPALGNLLPPSDAACARIAAALPDFTDAVELLQRAVIDAPPATIRDGGVIAPGFNADLDELRNLTQNAADWLAELEIRERGRSGIATLKVGYNRVHGYYLETSRSATTEVPVEYVRRQTLKNAERYITPELKAFEDRGA